MLLRRNPANRHCRTAASQPARLNTKVIAGSSPSRSRRATTSGRLGVRSRTRGLPPSGSYRRPASLLPGHAEKLGIDPVRRGGLVPVCLLRHEQVEQLAVGEHVLPQRHGTVLLHDDPGVAADGDQPFGEFLGVAHRRRQRDQADLQRQVDDDLFPDRTAETVGQVVDLVHDDVPEAAQRVRVRVDHVAEHLGRHDDDGSIPVAGDVAGQQPDRLLAVARRRGRCTSGSREP